MSSIVIAGDTSGSVTLQAPAVAGATILTLPATSGTVQTSGAGYTTNGVAFASSTSVLATGSALQFDSVNLSTNTGGTNATMGINSTSNSFYLQSRPDVSYSRLISSAYLLDLLTTASQPITFSTNSAERARIDASGNLMINTTSTLDAVVSVVGKVGAFAAPFSLKVATDGDYGFTFKGAAGALAGAIGVNASTVSYNTSSDYRLKNTIAPITGALAKVALLKPVTYKWNVDGSDGEGFIAHELAEVCPYAVTGAKDALDANGNIKPQGIDTSFLVATLTAAIQELKAEFDAYKASHP
jgi:hypothetical protein